MTEGQHTEECREAFEKWVSRSGDPDWRLYLERDAAGDYLLSTATLAWYGWQAAWQARTESGLVTELAEALESAQRFIRNGRDFGCIQMPDDPNDGAYLTIEMIDTVLARYKSSGQAPKAPAVEQPQEDCGCDWFVYSDGTPYQRHRCMPLPQSPKPTGQEKAGAA